MAGFKNVNALCNLPGIKLLLVVKTMYFKIVNESLKPFNIIDSHKTVEKFDYHKIINFISIQPIRALEIFMSSYAQFVNKITMNMWHNLLEK